MTDEERLERLRMLLDELRRVQGDSVEFREAGDNPAHPLNRWPYRERRAFSRSARSVSVESVRQHTKRK